MNRDYKFDQPGEDIAFLDSVIVPSFELTTRQDTTWKDSLTIDTIRTVGYIPFLPGQHRTPPVQGEIRTPVYGKARTPGREILYAAVSIRSWTPYRCLSPSISPRKTVPGILCSDGRAARPLTTGLPIRPSGTGHSAGAGLLSEERLPEHPAPANRHGPTGIAPPSGQKRKKKKKKDEPDPIVFLGMQVDAPGSMDLFDTISVTFNEPVLDINKEMFFLDQKIDTVWNTVDFDFFPIRLTA